MPYSKIPYHISQTPAIDYCGFRFFSGVKDVPQRISTIEAIYQRFKKMDSVPACGYITIAYQRHYFVRIGFVNDPDCFAKKQTVKPLLKK